MDLIQSFISSKTIVEGIDSQQEGVYYPDDLIYRNIFPYGYIPSTEGKADAYLLMFVDIPNINRQNTSFVDMRVTLWVLVHKDRQKMKNKPATRADYLAEELRKLLDGNDNFGCGVLQMISNREIILDNSYIYRELIFHTTDMKQSSHSKVGSFK